MYTVLMPDAPFSEPDLEATVTNDDISYHVYSETDPEKIPVSEWEMCDAVLVWHRMEIKSNFVEKLNKCKIIVRVGVGFDNIDTVACSRAGIPVSNVPNYGTTEVADHAIALTLDIVRGVSTYGRRLRHDLVSGFQADGIPAVRRIRGLTFGAIGLGRIGKAVVRRALGFDLRILFYDPFLSEGSDLALGYERARTLDRLLERSDIVSIHTPLNSETVHMIDARTLARMKPGAVLINVARGGLVDLDALYDALRSDMIAGAGLDVIEEEPPTSRSRLLDAWQRGESWLDGRLSITPHAAFYSEEGYEDMRIFSAQILKAWLIHGELRNNVNPLWEKARLRVNNKE